MSYSYIPNIPCRLVLAISSYSLLQHICCFGLTDISTTVSILAGVHRSKIFCKMGRKVEGQEPIDRAEGGKHDGVGNGCGRFSWRTSGGFTDRARGSGTNPGEARRRCYTISTG